MRLVHVLKNVNLVVEQQLVVEEPLGLLVSIVDLTGVNGITTFINLHISQALGDLNFTRCGPIQSSEELHFPLYL